MSEDYGKDNVGSKRGVLIGIVSAIFVVLVSIGIIIKTKFSSLLPEFVLYVVYLMILAVFSKGSGMLRSGIITLIIATLVVFVWAFATFVLPMLLHG
jgi:hypothetical protein